jgi:hypothetical protein
MLPGMRAALLVAFLLGVAPAATASPPFQPADFVAHVDNAWFPLRPGTVYVYRGVKDGRPSRDVVTVTNAKRTIAGVTATAVHDDLYVEGRLAERTTDWYAQDRAGNVWYRGEATAELDANGRVTSREGSWLAGLDGARPGIYMPADPAVGVSGRQEFLKGHAEDHFRVLALDATVSAPALTSRHELYVRGVGTVLEQTIRGGNERNALVSVKHP